MPVEPPRGVGERREIFPFLGSYLLGDAIEAALNHAGVRHSFVHVPGTTRINTKVVDPESHATTDINEPGAPVDSSALEAVLSKADAMMAAGDDLVLAGRLPPGV